MSTSHSIKSTAIVLQDPSSRSVAIVAPTHFSDTVAIQIYRTTFLLLKFLCLQANNATRITEELGFVDLSHFRELPMPDILHGLQIGVDAAREDGNRLYWSVGASWGLGKLVEADFSCEFLKKYPKEKFSSPGMLSGEVSSGGPSQFASVLLQELAGVSIPPERIYGLGTGPKVEVLKRLQKKPEHKELKLQ
ncbi:hypothetical protein Droror1_Dr00002340 [Drosera rotundifolia]